MTDRFLPTQFSELEPFAGKWCLATEDERYETRLASSMDELQALYDALEPRAEEAIQYCDQFPLDDLPGDASNLLRLLASLVQVSFPVECWNQTRVPDSGAARVSCVLEPVR